MKKKFNNYKRIWFDAMLIEDSKGWIFVNNFNCLYEIDLITNEIRCLGRVPGENNFFKGLYFNIVKHKQDLILVPSIASSIAIYNLDTATFTNIPIDLYGSKCYGAAVYEDKVFLIGNSTASIIVLDLKTKSIREIDTCVKYFESIDHIENRMFFRKNSCVVGECFYVASCVANIIVKIHMDTEKIEFIKLNTDADGFRNISFGENYFWITKWGECVLLRWDGKTSSVENVLKISDKPYNSSEIIVSQEKIYIFPTIGMHVIEYNLGNASVKAVDEFKPYIGNHNLYPWGDQKFTSVILFGKYIYAYSAEQLALVKFNCSNNEIERIDLEIADEDIKKIVDKSVILDESYDMCLEDFIEGIIERI